MRDLRGREISMIFQNPRAALNPDPQGRPADRGRAAPARAGRLRRRRREGASASSSRCASPGPSERYHAYPFELSGGMCQRVVIALALACRPQLLIADEPTTGLDVTTQKTVMDLVVELTRERGMSTILITHDLGLAAAYCDRVVVMEKGHVVETRGVRRPSSPRPRTPTPRKLMRGDAAPAASRLRDLLPEEDAALPAARSRGAGEARTAPQRPSGDNRAPLLVVENLVKEYPRKDLDGAFARSCFKRNGDGRPETQMFRAVDGISFTVHRGESVGLVGESGCGKSTTSTMVMRLIDKTDGAHRLRRAGHRRHSRQEVRQAAAAQAHPDGVPGPHRQPQPALHGGAGHRRSDPAAGRGQGPQGRARALRGAGAPGRAAARAARPLPAPAVGRAEGARRHRARDRAQPRPGHPRRADRGARRVGAGGGAQPAAGAQGARSA